MHRAVYIFAWSLLAPFIVFTAYAGGIAADVRLFQLSYVGACVGHGLLAALLSRSAHPGLNSVSFWLMLSVLVRLALLHTTPSDDVYRYVWEGRVQSHGFSPYALPPDAPQLEHLQDADWRHINHPDYTAIYPPLSQLVFRLVAAVVPSVFAFKCVYVAFDVVCVALLCRWLRLSGRAVALVSAYALNPLVLTAFAIHGHLDSAMLACLVAVGICATLRRHYWCGVLLAAAILTKLVPIVLLPWLARRSWRGAVLCASLVVAGYLPYADPGGGLFTSLLRFTGETQLLGPGHVGLSAVLGMAQARIAGAGVILCASVLASRYTFPACTMLSLGALLVMAPVVHAWYATWVLVAVPLALRSGWPWLVLAASMVFYFEADRQLATAGEWRMPEWVPWAVYAPFLVAVCIAFLRRRVPAGHTSGRDASRPVLR